MLTRPRIFVFLFVALLVLLTACGSSSPTSNTARATAVATKDTTSNSPAITRCPAQIASFPDCHTPYTQRLAYGLEPLLQKGFTGKGQSIVDIVSFGSPTLQQDMDVFDHQFGLPPIKIDIRAPIGTVPFNPQNNDMLGWVGETTLDVQIMHAIAPDAKIVVLTSPVSETEGTIGFPEFLKLEQYAISNHLGNIFSQSYAASEYTLNTPEGHALVNTYTKFYQQIATQQGITVLSSSGDNGTVDFSDLKATKLTKSRTVNYPASDPWVTSIGGTTEPATSSNQPETAWPHSGGGVSTFFKQPDYQAKLPTSVQSLLQGARGLPDVSANADPESGMAFYVHGQWTTAGGTSASAPLWAGMMAIANQMAGHPLGFINPALYKLGESPEYASYFHDITIGDNSTATVKGFKATTGWDAVTGWGTPNAEKLLPALIAATKS